MLSRSITSLSVRLAVGLLLAVALFLVSSCGSGQSSQRDGQERYECLDSMMRCMRNVDSLAALAAQSHDQNDALSEMLAMKYQGELLRNVSRFNEALTAHNRELALATELADTVEMSHALNNLGADYRRMGDLSMANGYFYESLKIIETFTGHDTDEALKARISALIGIGNIEIEMKDYYTADSLLRESLGGELRLGCNMGIAKAYGNLGLVKRDVGEIDSAWVYFRKALDYNQLAGNQVGVAICHQHFGDLHVEERRFSHALKEYQLAYDMLKVLDDNWHWMDAGLALARVNILLGEKDEANRYLEEVEAEAIRTGSKEFQAQACDIHYELSLLEGNTQEALQHYVQSKELYDSIYGLQRHDEMRTHRVNYERERASGEVNLLNRNISNLKRQQTTQVVFTVVLLLMAAAIIAALAYAMRVRSRTQRIMRQVERTRSLFFTNVVHQLRTPLSAIMGAIDGIIAEGNNADSQVYSLEQRENAELIERQGKNLLVLVDSILEVGSVRSAIREPDWNHVNVVILIRMVLESYRERCVGQHIELTYAPREANVEIDTVPRYVVTILSSLIENAINYSRELGKITVTSHVDNGMFIIRVADNGMGISKADLPHVFEPFYRSAAAEQLCEGVGIGLTVVRDMTMAMGGIVAADSMKDHGSVFTVKLPCKHRSGVVRTAIDTVLEPVKSVVRRPKHEAPSTTQDDGQDKPAVLIVEDHSDVARLLGLVLGNGYQIHYATNGTQGLSMASEMMPDLIITDVKMPLMDGLELCRHIRQSRALCHIPIIMLSARNSDSDRVSGIKAGADAYLVKPFVPDELRAWVSQLLESRQRLRDVFAEGDRHQEDSAVALPEAVDMQHEDRLFLQRFNREVDKQSIHGGKLNFDMLAHACKMGESQLRRKIQELTGMSVPAYVTRLRMEKAMRLLRESPDMLIGDIADQCGFQDMAYFSRVFRQQYGMTPTQARNRNK